MSRPCASGSPSSARTGQRSQRALLPASAKPGGRVRLMDEHLAGRDYFAGGRLSLADIALYAYTHVAEEGGFDLGAYPAVTAWLGRVAAAPGYVPMSA